MTLMRERDEATILVVHPTFDAPEAKRTGEGLGTLRMSPAVRLCLLALRVYLILMGGLLAYHLLDLAGAFGHGATR